MSLEERFLPSWKACTGCRTQPVKEMTACPKNVGRLLLKRLGKQVAAQRSHCALACEGDLQHEVSNQRKLPQELSTKERFIYFVQLQDRGFLASSLRFAPKHQSRFFQGVQEDVVYCLAEFLQIKFDLVKTPLFHDPLLQQTYPAVSLKKKKICKGFFQMKLIILHPEIVQMLIKLPSTCHQVLNLKSMAKAK